MNYIKDNPAVGGGRRGDEEKVRDEVNQAYKRLADYKRVKVVKLREEEFPKTTTRKIKRYLFKNGEQIAEG